LFLKLSSPEYTAELGISGRMKVAVLIALKLGYGVKCVDGEGYLGEVFFWGRSPKKCPEMGSSKVHTFSSSI
jgi:hypothetical protein